MTPEQLSQFLSGGEGLTVEYKKCVDELSNRVFEIVCSFFNRCASNTYKGGTP